MGILKPFGNLIKNLTPSPAPKGGTTRLNERIATNIGGTPPLDLRQFDPELAVRLGIPLVWNNELERWEYNKYKTWSAGYNPYSVVLPANTWTLVVPANRERLCLWVTSSDLVTNFSVSFEPTGLGNQDRLATDSFYTDKFTGDVYVKTTVNHAAEALEVVL